MLITVVTTVSPVFSIRSVVSHRIIYISIRRCWFLRTVVFQAYHFMSECVDTVQPKGLLILTYLYSSISCLYWNVSITCSSPLFVDMCILNEVVLNFIVPFLIFSAYLEIWVRARCESSNNLVTEHRRVKECVCNFGGNPWDLVLNNLAEILRAIRNFP